MVGTFAIKREKIHQEIFRKLKYGEFTQIIITFIVLVAEKSIYFCFPKKPALC